jgi:hypothetical protein
VTFHATPFGGKGNHARLIPLRQVMLDVLMICFSFVPPYIFLLAWSVPAGRPRSPIGLVFFKEVIVLLSDWLLCVCLTLEYNVNLNVIADKSAFRKFYYVVSEVGKISLNILRHKQKTFMSNII